jgi:hypothetical protein
LNSEENSINNLSFNTQSPFSIFSKDEIFPLECNNSELSSKFKIFFKIEQILPDPFLESQINTIIRKMNINTKDKKNIC